MQHIGAFFAVPRVLNLGGVTDYIEYADEFVFEDEFSGAGEPRRRGIGHDVDVVVFGDDYNDLVMFDERFYRIAMGNACDELKAKADYITDRNTSDGIYNACRVHGWIK